MYFIVICAVLFFLYFYVQIQFSANENKRLLHSGILDIDSMHGRVFEKYLNALFVSLEYEVELTSYVGDWGADLIIKKNGYRTVVQAKRYHNSVGVKAVQEVCAAKGKYNCHNAMVVTNNYFTKPALSLARANNVQMWNRDKLIDSLSKIKVTEPKEGAARDI